MSDSSTNKIGYIYLLELATFGEKRLFKFGHTDRPFLDRYSEYKCGSPQIKLVIETQHSAIYETHILRRLRQIFVQNSIGREYFNGDPTLMKQVIVECFLTCEKIHNKPTDLSQESVNYTIHKELEKNDTEMEADYERKAEEKEEVENEEDGTEEKESDEDGTDEKEIDEDGTEEKESDEDGTDEKEIDEDGTEEKESDEEYVETESDEDEETYEILQPSTNLLTESRGGDLDISKITPNEIHVKRKCHLCNKHFGCKRNLEYHIKHNVCLKTDSTTCPKCNYKFATPQKCSYHITHNVCGSSTNDNKSTLLSQVITDYKKMTPDELIARIVATDRAIQAKIQANNDLKVDVHVLKEKPQTVTCVPPAFLAVDTYQHITSHLPRLLEIAITKHPQRMYRIFNT
jgi:hypothetical protein